MENAKRMKSIHCTNRNLKEFIKNIIFFRIQVDLKLENKNNSNSNNNNNNNNNNNKIKNKRSD